ncbi:signal peptidase I [Krasilnikoviella flava]|uniref:Signal peptidase I n=1 Tax=Krasilnikoviella flava TaxID=526729 RepID=A0A1T5L769_9MICO|nr:signal peptidase I [Krasilnikoviella flava]SKC71565.1 signal peptidase, endoplasmic reticulum-type [Krasilnikoviella flava]
MDPAPTRPVRSARRVLGRVLAGLVLLVAGGALLLVVVVPRLGGGVPYGVATGSMSPALAVGTLVVVRPVAPDEIATGDVVTYQLRSGDPTVVTHRVVGLGTTADGERTLVTRGDANEVADPRPVRAVQVRGVLWYAVPQLGRVMGLGSPQLRQAITTAAAVLLLGYAGWLVAGEVRERRSRKGEEPSPGLETWWPEQESPPGATSPTVPTSDREPVR